MMMMTKWMVSGICVFDVCPCDDDDDDDDDDGDDDVMMMLA